MTLEVTVPTSSPITLASGQITRADMISIELVSADETPPAVFIHWPSKPSVIMPSPKALANVASSLVRIMAAAQAELSKIKGGGR